MSNSFSSMPIVYEKNAFSTPFLRGYKLLKIPIVNADGAPAWPELFPPSRIDQLRETVGMRHFSSQMMLECTPLERARLDPGGLQFYETEFDPRVARIDEFHITGMTLYWDPATGRRYRDGSACVLLYRDDSSRHVFIHDILYLTVSDEELFPLSHQCDMVLDFMSVRGLRRITIETNGLGIGLPEIMRDCAARRGTNAEHETFTGAPGEITVDTTANTLRVHDGQTPGGTALARADTVTDMAGTDYVIAWQAPSADNNYSWWRKYRSGWIEQGGFVTTSSTGFRTINLPIAMLDNHYELSTQCLSTYVEGAGSSHNYVVGKSAIINRSTIYTTSFQVYMESTADRVCWRVQGFCA